MRERSTWLKNTDKSPRQAATSRRADIYQMNQERHHPSPTEYENGSPDSWAETPVSGDKLSVNEEYEGGAVKRNEIGMPEFRSDTWKHKDSDKWGGSGRYDNARVSAEKKASAVYDIAKTLLKTSNEKMIESVATDFMALPDRAVVATIKALRASSTDSLDPKAKYKRSLFCAKIGARLLGNGATEHLVFKVGSSLMQVSDSILKTLGDSIIAADENDDSDEEDDTVAASNEDDMKSRLEGKVEEAQKRVETKKSKAAEQQLQDAKDELAAFNKNHKTSASKDSTGGDLIIKHEDDDHVSSDSEEACDTALSQADRKVLQDLLDGDSEGPDVDALVTPAAEVSNGISFDDDEGEADPEVKVSPVVAALFEDDFSKAQKEIRASTQGQGYRVSTASGGAKKIGFVSTDKSDKALEKLW